MSHSRQPDGDSAAAALHRFDAADPDLRYQMWWLERLPPVAELYRQRLACRAFSYTPTISIITPVFDTPPDILDRMLGSIAKQTYPHWQHCLVDDGSSASWLARYLERLAASDPRIRFERRPTNGGIVAASNQALLLATGDFIGMLDHDDELDPQALFAVVARLNEHADADVFYSDFDVIDRQGRHKPTWFLPDWAPELLLCMPFVSHFTVYRRSIIDRVGGWRAEYEGSQDYDLALRVASVSQKFVHLPQVLYHWRQWERSVASNPTAKPYAYTAADEAVVDHLRRNGIAATCDNGPWRGFRSIRFSILERPLISVIVPAPDNLVAADAGAFVTGIRRLVCGGGYDRCEVVVVAQADLACILPGHFEDPVLPMRAAVYAGARDAGAIANAGAAEARGDHLVFLAGRLEAEAPGWLSAMLGYSQQAPIGAVGATIFTSDGALWHAGVLLPKGVPHLMRHPLRAHVNYSAVSGVCLMTRRATFEQAGGFNLASVVGHSDFDYCLRLRDLGYRHVVTAHARVRFSGPPPGDAAAEHRRAFADIWGLRMRVDPYYSPNYDQDNGDFRLSLGMSGPLRGPADVSTRAGLGARLR